MWNNTGSFHAKGQTATARYNSVVILKKKKKKKKKTQRKTEKLHPRQAQKNVLLLHDNPPSHTASSIVEDPSNSNCCPTFHIVKTLPPVTFICFQITEKRLAGNKYETRVALISAVNRYLSSRSTSWFAEGI